MMILKLSKTVLASLCLAITACGVSNAGENGAFSATSKMDTSISGDPDLTAKKIILFDRYRIQRGDLEAFLSANASGEIFDYPAGPQNMFRSEKVYLSYAWGDLLDTVCSFDPNCIADTIRVYLRFNNDEPFKQVVPLNREVDRAGVAHRVISVSVPSSAEKIEIYATVEKYMCEEWHSDPYSGVRSCVSSKPLGTGFVSNFGKNFSMLVH